jgi:hypothetical protein
MAIAALRTKPRLKFLDRDKSFRHGHKRMMVVVGMILPPFLASQEAPNDRLNHDHVFRTKLKSEWWVGHQDVTRTVKMLNQSRGVVFLSRERNRVRIGSNESRDLMLMRGQR